MMKRNGKVVCKSLLSLILLSQSVIAQAVEKADNIDLFSDDSLGVILSATKLKTSSKEASGSVTKITREQIKEEHIRTLPQALSRFVAGMNSYQLDGNESYVSYRGSQYPAPRRMNVFIDGVSFTRIGFSQIDWLRLPINIEDVSYIEVYRGPNTATHGSNAFLANVNIVTLHPKQTLGWAVTKTVGALNTEDFTARYSTKIGDGDALRVSLGSRKNTGYDINRQGTERLDSTDSQLINYYYSHESEPNIRIDLQGGYTEGDNGKEPIFADNEIFPAGANEKKLYNRIRFTKDISIDNSLTAQLYHRTNESKQPINLCFPAILLSREMFDLFRSNQEYANAFLSGREVTGGSERDSQLLGAVFQQFGALGGAQGAFQPVCGDSGQNIFEKESEFNVRNNFVIDENIRAVFGGAYKKSFVSSQTFLNGKGVEVETFSLLSNVEIRHNENILNIGGMFEKSSLSEKVNLNPRASLSNRINEDQTVRLVYSKATRAPSIFEQNADWSYSVENLTPVLPSLGETGIFFQSFVQEQRLINEKIKSLELGYHLENKNTYIDLKVFKDDMSNLISEFVTHPNWNPTNSGWSKVKGAEIETRFKINELISLRANYAHADIESNFESEIEFNPRNTTSIFGRYSDPNQRASFGFYYADKVRGFSYSVVEFSYGRDFLFSGSAISLTLSGRHRLNDNRELLPNNFYKNKTHLFLTAAYTTE